MSLLERQTAVVRFLKVEGIKAGDAIVLDREIGKWLSGTRKAAVAESAIVIAPRPVHLQLKPIKFNVNALVYKKAMRAQYTKMQLKNVRDGFEKYIVEELAMEHAQTVGWIASAYQHP